MKWIMVEALGGNEQYWKAQNDGGTASQADYDGLRFRPQQIGESGKTAYFFREGASFCYLRSVGERTWLFSTGGEGDRDHQEAGNRARKISRYLCIWLSREDLEQFQYDHRLLDQQFRLDPLLSEDCTQRIQNWAGGTEPRLPLFSDMEGNGTEDCLPHQKPGDFNPTKLPLKRPAKGRRSSRWKQFLSSRIIVVALTVLGLIGITLHQYREKKAALEHAASHRIEITMLRSDLRNANERVAQLESENQTKSAAQKQQDENLTKVRSQLNSEAERIAALEKTKRGLEASVSSLIEAADIMRKTGDEWEEVMNSYSSTHERRTRWKSWIDATNKWDRVRTTARNTAAPSEQKKAP